MRDPVASMSLPTLFLIFLKVGFSFGAGTGMAAVLQDEVVRRRAVMERGEFMAVYGLARLVPSGSMTALAIAVGYRFQGWAGTVAVLLAMILPGFVMIVLLTIAFTMLSGSTALDVVDVTLMPAAIALVVVSTYRLASEFLRPSRELLLILAAATGVLVFGVNPSVLLVAGGLLGALVLRPREARD